MKISTLAIAAMTLFLSQQASAAGFVDLVKSGLQTPFERQAAASRKPSGRYADSCTNFSGDWEGECTNSSPQGDETTKNSMKLTQDRCDNLVIEGNGSRENYSFGAVRTDQVAASLFYTNVTTIIDWNTDRTELNLDMELLLKMTSPNGKVIKMAMPGRIYLDGSQLKFEGAGGTSKISCRYTRK